MIQRAVITGLTAAGVDVADLRVSPSAVTRHRPQDAGLAAGVHVAQSALDPEQVQIRIYESPGIQLTAGLEKGDREELHAAGAAPLCLRGGRADDVSDARP